MVNNNENKQDSNSKKQVSRSTTHIRIKKSVKFELEKWMNVHHCKTPSEAIKKLLQLTAKRDNNCIV